MAQNGNSAPHQTDLPIAIVGGGLGGLALAVGLRKHGIKIHIYEAAPVFSEIGAGVTFGANATRALGLIDPRLLQGYKKHATNNDSPGLDDVFLSVRWGTDESRERGHKAGDYIGDLRDDWDSAKRSGIKARSCIHRARFLDVLVSMIPEGITSFGKRFESVEELRDGTLKLHFTDGSHAFASAMIGCDGIKSKARKAVLGPKVEPSYTGEHAYRAMVPRAEAEAALGADLARNGQIYFGYGGYIVTESVAHGEFTNMVAIPHEPDESWVWDETGWAGPAHRDDFSRRFRGFYHPLVKVFRKYCHPVKWALFDLQHNTPYYRGRMCLLGDAAHATTPHMGAGAGMAMEDAYILSNLIAAAHGTSDLEDAFRAYDAVRRPRTQMLVERSKHAGLLMDFMMPGIGDDTNVIMKRLMSSYHWVWHEDLEAQLEHAKSLV
jgi:salicylate hydroxylase